MFMVWRPLESRPVWWQLWQERLTLPLGPERPAFMWSAWLNLRAKAAFFSSKETVRSGRKSG